MNRRVTILAVAAMVTLGTIAVWRLVSLGDRVPASPERTDPDVPPTAERERDGSEATLGLVDDDPRRESAVAPELSPAPSAAAPATLLRVRAISASTRAPLPRARLTVFPKDPAIETSSRDVESSRGSFSESPVTDADGRAEFDVPPDIELVLWIRGEEARAESGPRDVPALRPGETREMLVELATGDDLRFFGRVVRREDRAPLAGARVRALVGTAPSEGPLSPEIVSGADGLFDLTVPSWRHPHLRIEADGYGLAVVTPTKDHDTADRALVVALWAGATLDARVLDGAGAPLEGALVRMIARSIELRLASGDTFSHTAVIPDEIREGVVGRDGRCVLEDLPASVRFALEIHRGGQRVHRDADPLALEAGQVLEREWRIGGGGALAGLVVDQDDRPVADLEIWLARATSQAPRTFLPHESGTVVAKARSDSAGRFTFPDVLPGAWSIGPGAGTISEPTSSDVAPRTTRFEMTDGPQTITLRVHRGLYIRGRVVDPAGEARAKAHVWARDEAVSRLQAESGADGTFALGPLAPDRYLLQALPTGGFAPSEEVEAQAGQEDVVLRLRPGGSLRGRVVDAVTGRGCGAEMRLAPSASRSGWGEHGISWASGAEGAFDTDGLEAGLYGLSAGTQDGRFGVLQGIAVTAGAETSGLVVAVSPGGKLRLRYEGQRTKVHCALRFQGVPIGWGQDLEPKEPIEQLAPAGTLVLQLQTEDGEAIETQTVELGAGEEREVVFRDG